jgi:hypothetical protein
MKKEMIDLIFLHLENTYKLGTLEISKGAKEVKIFKVFPDGQSVEDCQFSEMEKA